MRFFGSKRFLSSSFLLPQSQPLRLASTKTVSSTTPTLRDLLLQRRQQTQRQPQSRPSVTVRRRDGGAVAQVFLTAPFASSAGPVVPSLPHPLHCLEYLKQISSRHNRTHKHRNNIDLDVDGDDDEYAKVGPLDRAELEGFGSAWSQYAPAQALGARPPAKSRTSITIHQDEAKEGGESKRTAATFVSQLLQRHCDPMTVSLVNVLLLHSEASIISNSSSGPPPSADDALPRFLPAPFVAMGSEIVSWITVRLLQDLSQFPSSSSIELDQGSAVKLCERLTSLLHVSRLQQGKTHDAAASTTTNGDSSSSSSSAEGFFFLSQRVVVDAARGILALYEVLSRTALGSDDATTTIRKGHVDSLLASIRVLLLHNDDGTTKEKNVDDASLVSQSDCRTAVGPVAEVVPWLTSALLEGTVEDATWWQSRLLFGGTGDDADVGRPFFGASLLGLSDCSSREGKGVVFLLPYRLTDDESLRNLLLRLTSLQQASSSDQQIQSSHSSTPRGGCRLTIALELPEVWRTPPAVLSSPIVEQLLRTVLPLHAYLTILSANHHQQQPSSIQSVCPIGLSFESCSSLCNASIAMLHYLEQQEANHSDVLLDHKPRIHALKEVAALLGHMVQSDQRFQLCFPVPPPLPAAAAADATPRSVPPSPLTATRTKNSHLVETHCITRMTAERRSRGLVGATKALVRRVLEAKKRRLALDSPAMAASTGGDEINNSRGDSVRSVVDDALAKELRNVAYRVIEPLLNQFYQCSAHDGIMVAVADRIVKSLDEAPPSRYGDTNSSRRRQQCIIPASPMEAFLLTHPLQAMPVAVLEAWRCVTMRFLLLQSYLLDTSSSCDNGAEGGADEGDLFLEEAEAEAEEDSEEALDRRTGLTFAEVTQITRLLLEWIDHHRHAATLSAVRGSNPDDSSSASSSEGAIPPPMTTTTTTLITEAIAMPFRIVCLVAPWKLVVVDRLIQMQFPTKLSDEAAVVNGSLGSGRRGATVTGRRTWGAEDDDPPLYRHAVSRVQSEMQQEVANSSSLSLQVIEGGGGEPAATGSWEVRETLEEAVGTLSVASIVIQAISQLLTVNASFAFVEEKEEEKEEEEEVLSSSSLTVRSTTVVYCCRHVADLRRLSTLLRRLERSVTLQQRSISPEGGSPQSAAMEFANCDSVDDEDDVVDSAERFQTTTAERPLPSNRDPISTGRGGDLNNNDESDRDDEASLASLLHSPSSHHEDPTMVVVLPWSSLAMSSEPLRLYDEGNHSGPRVDNATYELDQVFDGWKELQRALELSRQTASIGGICGMRAKLLLLDWQAEMALKWSR